MRQALEADATAKHDADRDPRPADGLAGFVEQLVNRVIKPLDLVVITRERIQETLDEAAERGRVTRADANELVAELVRRGRQQTDDVLGRHRAAARPRRGAARVGDQAVR